MSPIWYSSDLLSIAFSGEPMSGSWLDTALVSLAAWAPQASSNPARRAAPRRIRGGNWGAPGCMGASTGAEEGGSCTGPLLELLGGVVREARAFAANQRNVAGMRPAAKPVDDEGEAGGGLGQVR